MSDAQGTAATAPALLEVKGLRVSYGHVEAVRGVSLRVPERRIITLIGPNGAGKTSILSALAGLVEPAAGTVTLAGRDARARAISTRRCSP